MKASRRSVAQVCRYMQGKAGEICRRAMRYPRNHLSTYVAGALLVMPWVNPYAAGPSAGVWPWLISAACAAALMLWRKNPLDGKLIAAAWITAATVSAVMALLQYIGWAGPLDGVVNQTGPGQAFANLRQRNQLASLLSIGMAALLTWLRCSAPAVRVPAWAHVVALLLALGSAASASRTGLVQWTLLLILALCGYGASRRHLQRFAVQTFTVYLVAAAVVPWLIERITGTAVGGLMGRFAEHPGCESRRVLWSNVLTLITERPWWGWGWGQLDHAHYATLYTGARFCDILDNAHNLPLHLAVELGLPVALLLCASTVWWVWRLAPWREVAPFRQLAWSVLVIVGIHSLLEYPLWYGPFQMACLLSLGVLASKVRRGVAYGSPMGSMGLTRRCLAGAALSALAYAAWDYHRVSQIYLTPEARSPAYRDDTLAKIRGSWLFGNQVRFAELAVTPLSRANARWTFDTATAMLHYSPEPRVIEKVIESATMLGMDEVAVFHLARYRAAFPQDHARWSDLQKAGSGAAGAFRD